jgi:hypothetical protein
MDIQLQQWHGTQQELQRLENAVDQHCTCLEMADAGQMGLCPAHALLTSQSTLDRLLFVYRTRYQFIKEEFTACDSSAELDLDPICQR